jgi:hypothetical protein
MHRGSDAAIGARTMPSIALRFRRVPAADLPSACASGHRGCGTSAAIPTRSTKGRPRGATAQNRNSATPRSAKEPFLRGPPVTLPSASVLESLPNCERHMFPSSWPKRPCSMRLLRAHAPFVLNDLYHEYADSWRVPARDPAVGLQRPEGRNGHSDADSKRTANRVFTKAAYATDAAIVPPLEHRQCYALHCASGGVGGG